MSSKIKYIRIFKLNHMVTLFVMSSPILWHKSTIVRSFLFKPASICTYMWEVFCQLKRIGPCGIELHSILQCFQAICKTRFTRDDSFAFLEWTSLSWQFPYDEIMTHFPCAPAKKGTLNWQVTTNLTRSHQPQKQPCRRLHSRHHQLHPQRIHARVARYQFSSMIIIYNILPHANPAMLATSRVGVPVFTTSRIFF